METLSSNEAVRSPLREGEPVQVGHEWPTGLRWSSNYTFVREEGSNSRVRIVNGYAAGCEVVFPTESVRRVP